MGQCICLHFFEMGAIDYALELAKTLEDRYCKKVIFVISWMETYQAFLERADTRDKVVVCDTAALNFDRYDGESLSSEELGELVNYETSFLKRKVWDVVFEDRHLLYLKFGPAVLKKGRFVGRNRILRMYLDRLRTIKKVFEDFDVSHIVYATQDYGTAMGALLARVGEAQNKVVAIPNITKIGGRVNIMDGVDAHSQSLDSEMRRLRACCDEMQFGQAREYIQSARAGTLGNYYAVSNYRRPKFSRRVVASFQKVFKGLRYRHSSYRDQHLQRLVGLLILKMRSRMIRICGLLDKSFSLDGNSYIYYPLHIEPEINIQILGRGFTDQLDVIRRIARSLNSEMQLVVKEHPLYSGILPLDFYRELVSIPNVVLIPGDTPQTDVVNNSRLVVCISGTAALEAALLGIRSLVLGTPYFGVCRAIPVLDNISLLSEGIQMALSETPSETELELFVQAIFNTSSDFDVLLLGRASDVISKDELRAQVERYVELLSPSLSIFNV